MAAAILSLAVWLVCALSALWTASAAAQPGTGPRETVDQRFTAKRPHTPTGVGFTGSYHAAGDPNGNPPVMRRMVFYPPHGMRYDTGVPELCTASDIELQLRGAAACPPGSRLGGGTTEGLILMPFTHDFVFDHFVHSIDVLNNTNEQIVLVNSEGSTVVRGRFRPDGSLDFEQPACFPRPPAGGCVDNYIVQLMTSSVLPRYTKASGGRLRSYATTPRKCPARHYWRTKVRFWWADGSADSVVSKQPCRRPHSRR